MATTAPSTKQTFDLPPAYHQQNPYQPVHSDESEADLPPHIRGPPVHNSGAEPLPWRPLFLRRLVLFGFITIFVLVIGAIEGLLAASRHNVGIATSSYAQHYLWTYGPTAFLTVVAALWARTEYQSKMAAPWIRLSHPDVPASRTLLLDYVQQYTFVAIFRSLRNRDFTVSITATISIIIKILIVISTGLLSLSLAGVTDDSYPMVLQTTFLNDNTGLSSRGTLAWYVIQGESNRNLTLPDGVSGDYAFQSLQTTGLPSTAETRVISDGLTNTMDCEPIEVGLLSAAYPKPQSGTETLNLTLTSPSCNVSTVTLSGVSLHDTSVSNDTTFFTRFEQVQCDGTTDDAGKRALLIFGNMTYHEDYSNYKYVYDTYLFGALDKTIQLFCVPSYSMTSVEVVRNGTEVLSVKPVPGASSWTLDSVSAWDIMEAQFAAIKVGITSSAYGWSTNMSSVLVDVDLSMQLALNISGAGLQALDLMKPDTLKQVVTDYYQSMGAIIARDSLLGPASVVTRGSATINENRLMVSAWAAQWMVALLAVCASLTVTALFIVPRRGFLPCNPSALFRLVFISLHSRGLLHQLRFAGAADSNHLSQVLGSAKYRSALVSGPGAGSGPEPDRFCIYDTAGSHDEDEKPRLPAQISAKNTRPTILHSVSLVMLGLAVLGLMVALEVLLRKSNHEDGLGDIQDNAYIHYTWTAIPALAFGLLAMTFSSMDFEVRSLAPYMALTESVSRDAFMELEFLDATIPQAMYREIKLWKPWALATTTALLIASLFTTFSASLFQESSFPITTSVKLQANRSFDTSFPPIDLTYSLSDIAEISSLILASNYSFPRLTYDDLAFPDFQLDIPQSVNSTLDPSAVSISAVVPAVRSTSECRLYDSSQITTNLTLDDSPDSYHNPLALGLPVEWCGIADSTPYEYTIATYSNASYFSAINIYSVGCSEILFVWGKIDYDASPMVQHVAGLGCNFTLEGVDVNTTYTGTELNIDAQNPPQPIESTVRETTIVWDTSYTSSTYGLLYEYMATIGVYPQLLDQFFSLLVTSPWAVPLADLGDPSATDNVVAGIEHQMALIAAQAMAFTLVPANGTNMTLTEPITAGDNDAARSYDGFATTTTAGAGRRRVVQDASSTHVLVALLAVTLVLGAAGWAARPRADVLPRDPTSIASAVALLAGGNIPARLAPPAHQHQQPAMRTPAEVAPALGGPGALLWMGWGVLPNHEDQNEGGSSQFGIYVVNENEIAAAKTQWRRQESVIR